MSGVDEVVCRNCGVVVAVAAHQQPVEYAEREATAWAERSLVMIGNGWLLHRCAIGSALLHGAVVDQASGMVSVQAGCSVERALILLQERAIVAGATLEDIAHAVLEGSIRFDA